MSDRDGKTVGAIRRTEEGIPLLLFVARRVLNLEGIKASEAELELGEVFRAGQILRDPHPNGRDVTATRFQSSKCHFRSRAIERERRRSCLRSRMRPRQSRALIGCLQRELKLHPSA